MVGNERTILVLLFFVYFFWKKLFTIEKFVGCIQRMCNGNYGCNLVLFPSSILFRHHSIIESLLNDSLSILSCVIFSPLMLSSLKMSKWFPFSCVRSFFSFLFVCSFFFVVDDDVTPTPALTWKLRSSAAAPAAPVSPLGHIERKELFFSQKGWAKYDEEEWNLPVARRCVSLAVGSV